MEAFDNDVRDSAHFGIAVFGDSSTVRGNQISDMTQASGFGVYVVADSVHVRNNSFGRGKKGLGPYPTAIEVAESAGVEVVSNQIPANWLHAIELNGTFEPVTDALVEDNDVQGVTDSAIHVIADVRSPDILVNTLDLWGASAPAIHIEKLGDKRPTDLAITDNAITGRGANAQTGISLVGVDTSSALGNTISGVGIGVSERDVTQSQIAANQITNTVASGFWTLIGIQSINSSAQGAPTAPTAHLDQNTISRATTGITVTGPGAHQVNGNTLGVRSIGVQIASGTGGYATVVDGNTISRVSGVVTGIAISDITELQLTSNILGTGMTVGISMQRAPDANVANNSSTAPVAGLVMIDCANGTVTGNVVSNPGEVGFRFAGDDDVNATDNRVTNNGAIGIHYASGTGGSLQFNTLTSNGAGTSMRIGTDLGPPASCGPIAVSSLLAINNTLTLAGAPQSPQVLCDVDVASSSIQP
jgi:parallel beta-helix repeat protein